MPNYAIGILLVVIIIIIALWARNPIINSIVIGSFTAIAAGALWTWLVGDSSNRTQKEVPVVDGGADPSEANLRIKFTLKDVLRNTKHAAKSIIGVGAVAGTAGWGGDTVVEVLSIVLDSAVWLGQIAAIFLQTDGEHAETMRKIYALDFKNGVNGVHDGMKAIVAEAGGASSAIFAEVRRVYADTIEWLLSLLGTAISAAIPDDAGTVGWFVTETTIMALRTASQSVYWAGVGLYNALPEAARGVLQNPESLRNVALYTIDMLEKYIVSGKDDKWWTRVTKGFGRSAAVTTATFGVLLLNPILMFPVAGAVFLGGQFLSALDTVGALPLAKIMHGLANHRMTIPGIGTMTAVDAMILFMQKITVLTFAGLYILSDSSVAAADAPPADFVSPSIGKIESKEKNIEIRTPTIVASVRDPITEIPA